VSPVVLIVGAGQAGGEGIGNGRAIALLFARRGVRLVLASITPETLEETARLVRAEGAEAVTVAGDVTREEDCARFIAAAVDHFGGLDVLVNNVGAAGGDAAAEALDIDVWRGLIDTNLTGAVLVCKHALPALRQGGGAIVNVSSVAAELGRGGFGYRIAKAGLNAMTRSLALSEAPHGVRVNAVMLGALDTPQSRRFFSDQDPEALRRQRAAGVPMGRMGDAWDAAHAVAFLASPEAGFITGAVLPVDGGQLCKVG
jgi:NAD(P)-dependent dehydrogenase (short-subunit alcohol dehydrogenase family)